MENLRKHHDNFEAKLTAQEERLHAFDANATELIRQAHSEAAYIERRRDSVLAARQHLRDKARARKTALNDALDYQNFRRDADEVRDCGERESTLYTCSSRAGSTRR